MSHANGPLLVGMCAIRGKILRAGRRPGGNERLCTCGLLELLRYRTLRASFTISVLFAVLEVVPDASDLTGWKIPIYTLWKSFPRRAEAFIPRVGGLTPY